MNTLNITQLEKDIIKRALRHYALQCEMWRDAEAAAGRSEAGTWALTVERLNAVRRKVDSVRVRDELKLGFDVTKLEETYE